MTRRATARGAERTSLDGERADVLVCGASFAGLAVARALAHTGADVLLVDRYEIGERATSACAAPAPWLDALGLRGAIRQELPAMTFSTPHGSVRYPLPWRWAAFDYRDLCERLFAQTTARFVTATVGRRTAGGVETDRGHLAAPYVVDALGWKRVLGEHRQPPEATLSRGLEVHPDVSRGDDALDVWIERSLIRRGYAWRVPAGDHARIGVGSYEPRHHVKEPTRELAGRLDTEPVRWQGNWFPHRLRAALDPRGTLYVGDSAGHCLPLSGEGIRPAFYFGLAAGRAIARGRPEDYAAFSAQHARLYGFALGLQRLVPALPPRALTLALRALRGRSERMFGWYLAQMPESDACSTLPTSPSTNGASSRASSRTGALARS
jgi:flavin-dependent dehydrogenase